MMLALAPAGAAADEVDARFDSFLDEIRKLLPAQAAAGFDGADLYAFRLGAVGGAAAYAFVAVDGQPFGRAIQVTVPARKEAARASMCQCLGSVEIPERLLTGQGPRGRRRPGRFDRVCGWR